MTLVSISGLNRTYFFICIKIKGYRQKWTAHLQRQPSTNVARQVLQENKVNGTGQVSRVGAERVFEPNPYSRRWRWWKFYFTVSYWYEFGSSRCGQSSAVPLLMRCKFPCYACHLTLCVSCYVTGVRHLTLYISCYVMGVRHLPLHISHYVMGVRHLTLCISCYVMGLSLIHI